MNQIPFFKVVLVVCVNDEEAYNGELASVHDLGQAQSVARSFCADNRWHTVTPAEYLDSEQCTSITITIEEHDQDGDFDEIFRQHVFQK